jgi:hypothetical protein
MMSKISSTVLAFALLSTGCHQRQAPRQASSTAAPAQPAQSVTDVTVTITDDKGGCVGTLTPGLSTRVAVGCGGDARVLVGKSHGDGKRKYYDGNRNLVFECKFDDAGMKLKGADGRLLWKVNWEHEGKLKVSDNEEGGRPIELRDKHNRIEIEDEGRALGQVAQSGQGESRAVRAAGDVAFVVRGSASIRVFGLLLAERIPMAERLALQVELLSRGR